MNGRGEPSGSTYGNDDYWADSFDAATDWFAPVKTEARTSVGLLDRPETQGYPASDHPSFPPGALKITPEDVYEALGAEAEDMLATAEIDIDDLDAEPTQPRTLHLREDAERQRLHCEGARFQPRSGRDIVGVVDRWQHQNRKVGTPRRGVRK